MTLDPDTPIVLIGMPGSGKSTVGVRLARACGRRFVDSDRAIEQHCGVPVATIFEYEGEEGFRRRESAILAELLCARATVIATGGGAILAPSNRELLAARAFVVYLEVSLAELWRRVRRNRARPLLQTSDPKGRLAQLLGERAPIYETLADLTIASARQSAAQMAADIIDRLPAALQPPEARIAP